MRQDRDPTRYWDYRSDEPRYAAIARDALLLVFALIALGMWGCPTYNVWQAGLAGRAALTRAEQDRRIAVLEAQAKKDAAKALADAEIERAKGVDSANKIIGEGLKGHEEYLRYLWIMALEHTASSANGSTVVYVPTEANLPVLEAARLGRSPNAAAERR